MNLTIDKFHNCRILVVGDLMIDEYIRGEVDRISPEAPVPIVLVKDKNHTLGGSGNVVNNLVALGAKVSVITVTPAEAVSTRMTRCSGETSLSSQVA